MSVEPCHALPTQLSQTSRRLVGCVVVSATALMVACASAGAPAATQPMTDLKRQSAAIERELGTRNEEELRVRVVNVTARLLKGPAAVDANEAETIEAEVKAINAQLSSLNIQLLVPALRYDAAAGRLVW